MIFILLNRFVVVVILFSSNFNKLLKIERNFRFRPSLDLFILVMIDLFLF